MYYSPDLRGEEEGEDDGAHPEVVVGDGAVVLEVPRVVPVVEIPEVAAVAAAGGAGDHAGEGLVVLEEVEEHLGLVALRVRARAQEAGEVGDGVVPEALPHQPRQVRDAHERVHLLEQPAVD